MGPWAGALILIGLVVLILLSSAIKVINEWERGVVLRFGRYHSTRGPGIRFIIPIVDKLIRVDLRIVTLDVPRQEVMTVDNVPTTVNAIVQFRVFSPEKAVIEVTNYLQATSQRAQTALRSVIGQVELDHLLAHRDKVNQELQRVIDEATDPWGVKVVAVEVKDVEVPDTMKRAIARQAEAERERRAKVIHAEGEYQAAKTLTEAANILASQPAALQLRFLQTLTEIASERSSYTVFPLPIDLFRPFFERYAAQPSTPSPSPASTGTNPATQTEGQEQKAS